MRVEPFSYHRRVAEALENKEKELWQWFSSDSFAEGYRERAQRELSNSSVRLGPDDNEANALRYRLAKTARDALGLSANIALYKGYEGDGQPNAGLFYIPGEITVQFAGRILELLSEDELLFLLGHEIAHYKLYESDGGRFRTATRLLHWVCRRENAPAIWFETVRRLSLYTEIYCDTAGYFVAGSRDTAIRSLTKSIADFQDVNAKTYLQQAEAILAKETDGSKGLSHPELFIRAKAIANRDRLDATAFEAALVPLIEGPLDIGALDILSQASLRTLTRNLIDSFTQHEVNRTEHVKAQAQEYFADYAWPGARLRPPPALPVMTPQTLDYLGYVLLDFAARDRERDEEALAIALVVAKAWGFHKAFRKVAGKELNKKAAELNGLENVGTQFVGRAAHA
jgi:hypothetical protein